MSRLLVVANRLPVSVEKYAEKISFQTSPGGLATGLNSLPTEYERHWVGWPGIAREELNEADIAEIEKDIVGMLREVVG